jgi:acyl transferase domain-containing protein/acyl carrier protein
MEGLGEAGHRVYVEIGPGTTLLGLGRQCLEGREGVWLASLRRGESDWRQMLNSLGTLYEQGAEVNWAGFDQPYDRRRVSLPTYPFERQRYWMEARPEASRSRRAGSLQHPFLTSRVPAAIPIYEGILSATAFPFLADHRVGGTAILPAPAYIELALAAAAETSGAQTGVIHDLNILEPVRLTERPHQVQVVLTPSHEGGAGIQIFARPEAGEVEAGWTLHATGRLGRGGNTARGDTEPLPDVSATEIPPEKFYELLRSREFDLGPACRVIRALRCGPGHAVAQVEMDASISGDSAGCHAHPALVDGWFQTLGAALALGDNRSDAPSYVLARVGDFRLYERPRGRLTVHAAVFPDGPSGAMAGRLAVFDAAGKRVAEADGIGLRRIESSGGAAPDDWFYKVEWQRSGKAPSEAAGLAAAHELAQGLEPVAASLGARKWNDRYDLLRAQLDSIVALHIVDALRHLGLPLRAGDEIPLARLADCGVLDRHRSLLARMVEILREEAVLEAGDGTWKVLRSPECGSLPVLWDSVVREFPEFSAELDMTSRCASELAKVLQGKTDPLHLLFPDGSSAALEKLYTESPVARMMNELVGRAVRDAVAGLAADRPLRVLEIGAGTGSSTRCIAPLLPAGRTQYVFTDVSPLFLERARETLSAYPFVEYKLLDIENDPVEQGFDNSQYDVVVAANVLHATADLRRTVANAAGLLAPGGLLIALEGTRPERWVDLTFGMTEGWWKYSDRDLRPEYPLLTKDKWLALLNELGFNDACAVEPAPGANQVLLLGRAPVRHRQGRWLLVGDASRLAASVAARVEQLGGSARVVAPAECTAELLEHCSYDHVVDLTHTVTSPVVTPAGNTSIEIVRLVQLLLAKSTGRSPRLWLVTRGAQPLPAARPIAVEQTPVWGVARTVALEHPALWGCVLDLDPEDSADQCAACVVDSVIGARGSENQMAFRSGSYYVPRLVRCASPPARSYRFLPDAAYLITGGQGSLGLSVARWMVENGARKLVLAGRTAPGDSRSEQPPSGSRARRARAIEDIEALGATVHAIALDIAEPGQLNRLAEILAPGELRGIVHAAAVFDSSPLAGMTAEAFTSVMRPKVEGSWLLHEWSRSQKLDFFVMFSSTTALLGSRNLAHYAAANQFLDGLAYRRAAEGLPALVINWGTWDEMGDIPEEQRTAYRKSGLHPMRSSLALNALGRLLGSPASQAVVAEIDWDVLRGFYEARRRMPFLSSLATAPGKETVAAPAAAEKSDLAAAVARALPGDRQEMVTAFVRGHAAAVLGLRPDEVDVKAGLFEIGMDSLMSVELKGRLQKGVGMPLPSTLTFNYPTVIGLSSYLLEKLGPVPASADVPDQPPPPVPPAEDDERSEDELAAMLADALRKL